MDKKTLLEAWMEPGTDYREDQFTNKERTLKFNRLPMGEKGIGRFAAHKLGDVIEISTRKKGHPELYFKIDWRRFEKKKYLSKIKIRIKKRAARDFPNNEYGTRIRITKIRRKWSRGMIRDAYRAITSIVDPFEFDDSKFLVEFDLPDLPDALEGLMESDEIQDYALWYAEGDIVDNELKLKYEFIPWKAMRRKLKPRKKEVTENVLDPFEKKPVHLDLTPHEIGDIHFKFYVYDRDPNVLKLLMGETKQLKTFLDSNGGIRVYRDDIRVYDYGEIENDWLSLDIRRVNIPTRRLSNNIVVGAVYLERENSEELIEKTNREGFVENEAYRIFRKAVLYVVSVIENERHIDKFDIRKYFGPTKLSEPVYATFSDLKGRLESKIKNVKLRKRLVRLVDKAEREYNEIRENLLTSSGAGLSLSIVIHEFEKIVKELLKVVEREKSSERIAKLVSHLAELTEGFTALIRTRDMEDNDLVEIIEQALFNVEYRLGAHNIRIIDRYSNVDLNTHVKCSRNYVLMVMMNLIDNSIWWLQRKYKNKEGVKRIFVKLIENSDGNPVIVVADNGPGFSIPTEYAKKPFVTKKPGGMGLGLYITDEIMKSHGGQLQFPEKGDISLPKAYRNGATVCLLFERGKNKSAN
jgi:signal transduction histidine kinase